MSSSVVLSTRPVDAADSQMTRRGSIPLWIQQDLSSVTTPIKDQSTTKKLSFLSSSSSTKSIILSTNMPSKKKDNAPLLSSNEILEKVPEMEDLIFEIESLETEVTELSSQKKYREAVQRMNSILEIRIEIFSKSHETVIRHVERTVAVCNTWGMYYLALDKYSQCLELLKRAEELTNPSRKLKFGRRLTMRSVTFNNLACYYRKRKKLHAALKYVESALLVESRAKKIISPSGTHLNYGAILSELGQHSKSLEQCKKARHFLDQAQEETESKLSEIESRLARAKNNQSRASTRSSNRDDSSVFNMNDRSLSISPIPHHNTVNDLREKEEDDDDDEEEEEEEEETRSERQSEIDDLEVERQHLEAKLTTLKSSFIVIWHNTAVELEYLNRLDEAIIAHGKAKELAKDTHGINSDMFSKMSIVLLEAERVAEERAAAKYEPLPDVKIHKKVQVHHDYHVKNTSSNGKRLNKKASSSSTSKLTASELILAQRKKLESTPRRELFKSPSKKGRSLTYSASSSNVFERLTLPKKTEDILIEDKSSVRSKPTKLPKNPRTLASSYSAPSVSDFLLPTKSSILKCKSSEKDQESLPLLNKSSSKRSLNRSSSQKVREEREEETVEVRKEIEKDDDNESHVTSLPKLSSIGSITSVSTSKKVTEEVDKDKDNEEVVTTKKTNANNLIQKVGPIRSDSRTKMDLQLFQWRTEFEYEKCNRAATIIQVGYRRMKSRRIFQAKWRATLIIQQYARRWIAKKRVEERKLAVLKIQSCIRMWQVKVKYQTTRRAAIIIQAGWRGHKQRETAKERRQAALIITRSAKASLMRRRLERSMNARSTTKNQAATKIQATYRGYRVRKRLKRTWPLIFAVLKTWIIRSRYLKKKKAAIKIQTQYRGYAARKKYQRKKESAVIIQSAMRGKLTRIKVRKERDAKQREIEDQSAIKIQSIWRGYSLRSKKEKEEAVVKIQKVWRGYNVRRQREKEIEAATTIQRFLLGYWARQLVKEMKREVASKFSASFMEEVVAEGIKEAKKELKERESGLVRRNSEIMYEAALKLVGGPTEEGGFSSFSWTTKTSSDTDSNGSGSSKGIGFYHSELSRPNSRMGRIEKMINTRSGRSISPSPSPIPSTKSNESEVLGTPPIVIKRPESDDGEGLSSRTSLTRSQSEDSIVSSTSALSVSSTTSDHSNTSTETLRNALSPRNEMRHHSSKNRLGIPLGQSPSALALAISSKSITSVDAFSTKTDIGDGTSLNARLGSSDSSNSSNSNNNNSSSQDNNNNSSDDSKPSIISVNGLDHDEQRTINGSRSTPELSNGSSDRAINPFLIRNTKDSWSKTKFNNNTNTHTANLRSGLQGLHIEPSMTKEFIEFHVNLSKEDSNIANQRSTEKSNTKFKRRVGVPDEDVVTKFLSSAKAQPNSPVLDGIRKFASETKLRSNRSTPNLRTRK